MIDFFDVAFKYLFDIRFVLKEFSLKHYQEFKFEFEYTLS